MKKFLKIGQFSVSALSRYSGIRCVTQPAFGKSLPASKEKWDLCAGILVERLPVVSKALNEVEKEFQQYLWQVEFENSLKSDHELQHERDLLHAQLIQKGEVEVDLDDSAGKQTAQDLKDAYDEEFKKFQLAPILTDDDAKNNLKSPNRQLKEILFLLVEQKFGKQSSLALPQGKRQDGESMRQTAERVLKEVCGDSLKVNFYGNSPCGFYKYKYPAKARDETVGAKVFFFRTKFQGGNVDEKVSKKFEWRNRETLGENLNSQYVEGINRFLF